MPGAARLGLKTLGLLVVLAGALRCAYAPDPPSGKLMCSANGECPEGYMCGGGYCFKKGETDAGQTGVAGQTGASGHGAAGAAGTGAAGTGAAGTGAGGAAGSGPPCAGTCSIKIQGALTNATPPGTAADSKFVGHWVFDVGSTETRMCSDGSNKTVDLASDYVDLTQATAASPLVASYFCDWNLTVGPLGNATVIASGQSCSSTLTDPKTGVTHFTYHGTTFTFATTGTTAGKNATLSSMIAVEFIDDPAKTGCTP